MSWLQVKLAYIDFSFSQLSNKTIANYRNNNQDNALMIY